MPFQKGHNAWTHRKKKVTIKPEEPKVADVIADFPTADVSPEISVKGVTVVPFDPNNAEKHKETIKRHTIGMMGAIESLYGAILTPKCRKCYDERGWLTKCICVEK